jgi:hypothetical protein
MPADSKYANFKLPDMGKSFEEKQEEARRVLTELYTASAPKKLNDIPTLLEAYAGQEDELIAGARLKYAKADQVYKKKRGFGKQGAGSSSSGGGAAAAAAAAAMAVAVAARAARWAQPWCTLYRAAVTARAWWMRLAGSRRRGAVHVVVITVSL